MNPFMQGIAAIIIYSRAFESETGFSSHLAACLTVKVSF
jgi:hypothetical protein